MASPTSRNTSSDLLSIIEEFRAISALPSDSELAIDPASNRFCVIPCLSDVCAREVAGFVILDPAPSHLAHKDKLTDETNLTERLTTIYNIVSVMLSNSSDLDRDLIDHLSLACYSASFRVKRINEHSPLINQIERLQKLILQNRPLLHHSSSTPDSLDQKAPASADPSMTHVHSCSDLYLTEFKHPNKDKKYFSVLASLIYNLSRMHRESLKMIIIQINKSSPKSAIAIITTDILRVLDSLNASTPDAKKIYTSFNTLLRKALDQINQNSQRDMSGADKLCIKIIKDLCYIKFTKIHIFSYLSESVSLLSDEESKAPDSPLSLKSPTTSSENLHSKLFSDNTDIANAPPKVKKPRAALAAQKFAGTVNIGFDPSFDINTPYVRSSQSYQGNRADTLPADTKTVLYLRHGSPTMESAGFASGLKFVSNFFTGAVSNAVITPEYKCFVSYAEEKGDMVFYCNHQWIEPRALGDESDRCKAIQNMEKRHKNFHFLSLPMGDGPLFDKNSPTFKTTRIDTFKSLFIQAFTDKTRRQSNGIAIPASCDGINLKPQLERIFNEVHSLFFDNKANLSSDEKIIFTLAFNSFVKKHIQFLAYEKMVERAPQGADREKIQAGKIYTVSACKDNIDRGGTSSTLDEFLYLVSQGEENNAEKLNELRINHAAPAILVKRQNVIPRRQHLLEIFIDHFNRLTEEQKDAIRGYSPNRWGLTSHTIPQS